MNSCFLFLFFPLPLLQYEPGVLEACMNLLQVSPQHQKNGTRDYLKRGDPVYVGRVVSAMVGHVFTMRESLTGLQCRCGRPVAARWSHGATRKHTRLKSREELREELHVTATSRLSRPPGADQQRRRQGRVKRELVQRFQAGGPPQRVDRQRGHLEDVGRHGPQSGQVRPVLGVRGGHVHR